MDAIFPAGLEHNPAIRPKFVVTGTAFPKLGRSQVLFGYGAGHQDLCENRVCCALRIALKSGAYRSG
ncbi:hypothetical protein, partial [Comamonas thiooxydans]|uniref:hypothetical protein n=1 Tax=Comamonas thiooxydans TaxID=363952 RepID=UPI001C0EAA52